MKFRKYPASKKIRHLIPYYWTLEKNVDEDEECIRFIPDGFVEWIFQLNTPWTYSFAKESNNFSASSQFLGQLKSYMEVVFPEGAYQMLAVKFYPWAARSIWGINMAALTQQHVAFDDLRSTDYLNLEDQLLGCENISARIKVLDNYFEFKLNNIQDNGIKQYINHLTDPLIPFSAIQFDRGPRRIQQLFKDEIGISAKLFHKTVRINQVIADLFAQRQGNLTQLAYRYHYADQSHLIKEFQRFTGYAPTKFMSHSRLDGDMFNLKSPESRPAH